MPRDEQPFSVCAQNPDPIFVARLLPQINRRCKAYRLALGRQLVKEDSLKCRRIGKNCRFRSEAAKGE
jgi:hypothetical protein